MENKKIILEEINRIREVMGLSYRNVIMENLVNPQILQKGRPYVEKILESFGFKGLDKATLTNARKILTDFQSVLSKSTVKPGAEIEEAISLALKRDGVNPATKKVFENGAERLNYVMGKMEQNIDDLEKSLSAAEQNASQALDRMFVEISQTTSGRNIEYEMNYLIKEGQSKNSAIGYLRTQPEYSSVPEWYWKRLENLKEFTDSEGRKYVDFDKDPIKARSAIEKIEASEGRLKEVWDKIYSVGDEVTLEQAFQNEEIRKYLDNTPLFRRATPEQQEKIRETMISTANQFITTRLNLQIRNADDQIDNLIELFKDYTLTRQQKQNLINYAIKQNGVKYPWLPNPFAKGGVDNILRQLSLKDQNGQSIFSGSRYKKLIDEPNVNWMKEEGDIRIFAAQFFKLSAAYWLKNIFFSTGFAVIEGISTFDDPNFNIDEISNNTIIGFMQRANAADWLLRAALPLPVVYSIAAKELLGMAGEGFFENDRMASFNEIFESPDWKFKGKKESGEYRKKKGSESPDINSDDTPEVKEKIDKYTNYLEGINSKNYGIWYYSEKENKAKLWRAPIQNAAEVETTTTGAYTDDVAGFTKWYSDRGDEFKAIVNKADPNVWNPNKDDNGYYVNRNGNKRWKFVDANIGFEPTN